MPIDLSHERVLTLRKAARFLPRQRGGKSVHISTLYRWASAGVGGVRLETLKLGGRVVTSIEAIERFALRCSMTDSTAAAIPARRREREVARAERQLDEAGI